MSALLAQLEGAMPDALVKRGFGPDLRRQLYRALSTLLRNREPMIDALGQLYGIYSDDGRRPSAPAAVFLYEAQAVVSQGRPFSDALRNWVGPEEASLVATGEKSGRIEQAFESAIKLVKANSAIRGAIIGAATYPVMMILVLLVQLGVISYYVVPELTATVDPDILGGAARVLMLISNAVVTFGPYLLPATAALVAWSTWSLPRLTGAPRLALERVPPWSTYRAIVGSTFLSNIAVMLRNGIPLEAALEQLRTTASPYLAERIDGALHGVRQGKNLGDALHLSEMQFPDTFAIRMIRPLASKDGFDVALDEYATEWAGETLVTVQRAMGLVRNLVLVAIAAVVVLVPLATLDIKAAIETAL